MTGAVYVIIRQIEYQMPTLLGTAYLCLDDAAAAIEEIEPDAERIRNTHGRCYRGRRCEYRIERLQLKSPEG